MIYINNRKQIRLMWIWRRLRMRMIRI